MRAATLSRDEFSVSSQNVIAVDSERIMGAFEWRLGLLPQDADAGRDWERVEKWLLEDSGRLEDVALRMADPLIKIILWGLLSPEEDAEIKHLSPGRWLGFKSYLADHSGIAAEMALQAVSYIGANPGTLESRILVGTSKAVMSSGANSQPLETTMDKSNEMPESPSGDEMKNPEDGEVTQSSPTESASPEVGAPDSLAPEGSSPETAPDTSSTESSPPSSSPQWKYLEVPEGPEKHDESYCLAGESPEGLKIIGARVRGKKHKHEGTNCDDWFEFGASGSWTIIAVSDGAGSKVLSRIGAKESCRTALNELTESLANHDLKKRDNWSNDTFKRDKQTGVFAADDLEYVQKALHNAMQKAYDAVDAKAKSLADSKDSKVYEELLGGRTVTVDDLSGTLLLAVHTTVKYEDTVRSFVLTCQIGDGMLAAITSNGGLQLLGIPDSGEFAGQTDFLTSRKKLEPASLTSRTFPFFGPMQALMLMSDGVADDYFPNDPQMLRLYGDLAINGILHLRDKNAQALIDSSLAETKLINTDGVAAAGLASPVEAVTADGPRQVFIRSFGAYAEKLGLGFEEVVKSTPLLMAGTIHDPGKEEMCSETESEEMLRVWLDSYYNRGSFDDRTLVVLYREVAS
jgi:hypothetical protein